MGKEDPKKRANVEEYLSLATPHVNLKDYLGDGTDGAVWSTDRSTAVKVFDREQGYLNERDTYFRLAEFGVTEQIDGFWIPQILDQDDERLIVEMDFMQNPPYIIDFAKVRLNSSPDFSEETQADSEARGLEEFGDDWPKVKSLMYALESYLIYYLDPRPHNIVCR